MAKKRKFQAIKADTSDFKGVRHDGKDFKFDKNDTFIVEDEGVAREMESMYGKKGSQKLAITSYTEEEAGHRYTFATSKKYADAWEAFEKRRKDKKKPKETQKRRKSAEAQNEVPDSSRPKP